MDELTEAKLNILDAYHGMLNRGQWITWLDGTQYFVIKPEDFHTLMDPYDALLDAEHEAEVRKQR